MANSLEELKRQAWGKDHHSGGKEIHIHRGNRERHADGGIAGKATGGDVEKRADGGGIRKMLANRIMAAQPMAKALNNRIMEAQPHATGGISKANGGISKACGGRMKLRSAPASIPAEESSMKVKKGGHAHRVHRGWGGILGGLASALLPGLFEKGGVVRKKDE